jgi:ectoine hydroxylase-related dioxygenase (phytanoyl-CoA dioxygenase family)
MGDAADQQTSSVFKSGITWWQRWDEPWREYPELAELGRSEQFAQPLANLSGEPAGIRYLSDQFAVKRPAVEGNTDTPWHQDNPYLAIDRPGDLTVWVALHDMVPECGTMRFLQGSHGVGALETSMISGADLERDHPEIWETYTVTAPLHLDAGDATVHNGYTIHCAPANSTDRPRWAYISEYIPGDARVDRLPNARADAAGLNQGDPWPEQDHPLTVPGRGLGRTRQHDAHRRCRRA